MRKQIKLEKKQIKKNMDIKSYPSSQQQLLLGRLNWTLFKK
jgi:hypothetical protein